MDNYSGVRLPDRQIEFLSTLERELGIPIRIIDTANRAATPSYDAHEAAMNELGLSTTVVDRDYGGFQWRPTHHPDGFNMSEGLTILTRSSLTPNMTAQNPATMIGEGHMMAGTPGRNLLDRLSRNGEMPLVPDRNMPLPDYVQDVQEFPWPDWEGDGEPPPLATAFTMEVDGEPERFLAYGFTPGRQNTGNREGRVPREVLYRTPIEGAVGNIEEVRARQMEQARERFREFATGRLGARVRDVRGTVSGLESDVALHQQALLDSTVRLREEKITLDTLLQMEAGESTGIDPDAEWEAIERHAMVDSFAIQNNRFVIETVELTLTDPDTGETAPLGRMRITWPMQPGSGRGMQITNLTNARDDGGQSGMRHHPHVPANGTPCFGNVMSEVARMGAAGEVGGLLELILQYLQTFNPRDDYGRYAGLWYEGEIRSGRRQ